MVHRNIYLNSVIIRSLKNVYILFYELCIFRNVIIMSRHIFLQFSWEKSFNQRLFFLLIVLVLLIYSRSQYRLHLFLLCCNSLQFSLRVFTPLKLLSSLSDPHFSADPFSGNNYQICISKSPEAASLLTCPFSPDFQFFPLICKQLNYFPPDRPFLKASLYRFCPYRLTIYIPYL